MESTPKQNGTAHRRQSKSKKSKKQSNPQQMVNGPKQDVKAESGHAESSAAEEGTDAETTAAESRDAQESSVNEPEMPHQESALTEELVNGVKDTILHDLPATAAVEERLEAAARERDQLREEVTELRRSLETIQQQHEEDVERLNTQLGETQSAKEHAEGQYQKLMGRVNNIRSQLGERMKADAEELSRTRTRIEELEKENKQMSEDNGSLTTTLSNLNMEVAQKTKEVEELRGRTSLSQQNWAKERDDLVSREAYLREEYDTAKQAMQDWEVLAMEERSLREGLTDRVSELEDQLSQQREAYDRAAADRDGQSSAVDGLQRALSEIQEARRTELREIVENSQKQLEELRSQLKAAEESSAAAQSALETARQELERALPFEKEVKEKNLLIGKLRHEAVTLNDHLTKALRFLKRTKPDDTVSRELVTNHVLQFLALDRSDPKKFQVLQLISALLGWTDEQKEQSGLSRPGASSQSGAASGSLRVPMSPFRRVSSSTALSSPMGLNNLFTAPSGLSSTPELSNIETPSGKDNLAELWSGFLEREAQEGSTTGSRRDSESSRPGSAATGSLPFASPRMAPKP